MSLLCLASLSLGIALMADEPAVWRPMAEPANRPVMQLDSPDSPGTVTPDSRKSEPTKQDVTKPDVKASGTSAPVVANPSDTPPIAPVVVPTITTETPPAPPAEKASVPTVAMPEPPKGPPPPKQYDLKLPDGRQLRLRGVEVYLIGPDGRETVAPDGLYVATDGKMIPTEDGKIQGIR